MTKTKAERAAELRNLGLTVEEIAQIFNWTYRTAAVSISRGKRPDYYREAHRLYYSSYERKPRARKAGQRVRGDVWSDYAIRYVVAGYGVLSAREIAAHVGRSRSAVIGKARRLGLSVPA